MKTDAILRIADEATRSSNPQPKVQAERQTAIRSLEMKEVAKAAASQQEALKQAIDYMARELESIRDVRLHYDHSLNRVVITVMDGDTGEVVRQVPSDEFISFARRFEEYLGLIVNRRV